VDGVQEKLPLGLPEFAGPHESLLTAAQVAERLCVSRATVYKLVSRGMLSHLRFSNAVRVSLTSLEAYLVQLDRTLCRRYALA
jgi:excisionase family DNA binding protein